ncbi:cupin domain-containing protein [Bradyrhizobium sp. RDM12]
MLRRPMRRAGSRSSSSTCRPARVSYSPWGRNAFTQQLLMLEGAVCVHIDAKAVRLRDGDCLDFDVMRAVIFENETKQDARYVIITRRGTSYGKM